MVQALAMIVAVLIVLVNLVTDMLYLVVDPRIRFGGGAHMSAAISARARGAARRAARRAAAAHLRSSVCAGVRV